MSDIYIRLGKEKHKNTILYERENKIKSFIRSDLLSKFHYIKSQQQTGDHFTD